MKREDKDKIIDQLAEKLEASKHFYLADIGDLNAGDTSELRRKCFEKEVELIVVKNTLLQKALSRFDNKFEGLYEALKGHTSVMLTENNNVPAKIIKEFRKNHDKPLLKGAFVEESIYIGENNLDVLVNLKSKEELLGDIISLLQSPIRNVISSLESGKNILAGVVKTLSEK